MRSLLATVLLALLATPAAADDAPLRCLPQVQVFCALGTDGQGATCTHGPPEPLEVLFWPDSTPVDLCRASHCPPVGTSISICGEEFCGSGAVEYGWEGRAFGALRKGMAYVAPDPGPRLYTATFFALAFEVDSGTLALSRFDPKGLLTTWFACSAEVIAD